MNSQTQSIRSHAHTALNIMIIYQVAINLCLKIYFLSAYLFHSYTPWIETQKLISSWCLIGSIYFQETDFCTATPSNFSSCLIFANFGKLSVVMLHSLISPSFSFEQAMLAKQSRCQFSHPHSLFELKCWRRCFKVHLIINNKWMSYVYKNMVLLLHLTNKTKFFNFVLKILYSIFIVQKVLKKY